MSSEDDSCLKSGRSLTRQNDRDAYFGWIGRDGSEELRAASKLLQGDPLFQQIIDAMPISVSVLNDKGQVILMNRRCSESRETAIDCALGKRHGELFCCLHSKEEPDGCGTTQHCEGCGAFVSIQASRRSRGQETREYQLNHQTPMGVETEDLLVTSTPLRVGGQNFIIFAVQEMAPAHNA